MVYEMLLLLVQEQLQHCKIFITKKGAVIKLKRKKE